MKNKIEKYHERINRGFALMANSSVAICGLIRDGENSLNRNIEAIELLRNKFKESYIIIIENDSIDNTKEVLKEWKRNSKNIIISSKNHGTETIKDENHSHSKSKYFSLNRIQKMSEYRNMYLDIIKNESLNPDFVIMIDIDVFRFDIQGVANSFGFEEEWDSINANGRKITPRSPFRPLFYDTYAYKDYESDKPTRYPEIIANQKRLASLKITDNPIRVKSGFNGLAIYKWQAIKTTTYSAKQNNDDIILYKCEHLSFHEDMIENGNNKIYVNPSMIVEYENFGLGLLFNKIKKKFLH